jgi:hypothetical protein
MPALSGQSCAVEQILMRAWCAQTLAAMVHESAAHHPSQNSWSPTRNI